MVAQITGGTLKYGETRKIADFENKRADVELSFNVAENDSSEDALNHVKSLAKRHCYDMLNQAMQVKAPTIAPVELIGVEPGGIGPKVHNKRAPKMPTPEHLGSAAIIAAKIAEITPKVVEINLPDPATLVDPISEICVNPVLAIHGKIITDEELMDATSKTQQNVRNAIGIRKLIAEMGVKVPPGRVIEIPQLLRQDYLDKLKLIKPLA